MRDMLNNDVCVGDYILIYDINHMNLTRVKELLDDGFISVEDESSYKQYNPRKCLVINEQRKHIIEKFPERFI